MSKRISILIALLVMLGLALSSPALAQAVHGVQGGQRKFVKQADHQQA